MQAEQHGWSDAETRTGLLILILLVIFRRCFGAPQAGEDERRFGRLSGEASAARAAEEAVSRSQKTFAELVERSPFGTYVVDSQFRIAMMNAASQDGAFRNVRPVIGRPFDEAMRILWPEPVAAEIIGHFRHTLDTGEPYYSPRFINPRHDVGDRRSLRVGTASHDAAGRPIRRHLLLLRFHEAAPGRGGAAGERGEPPAAVQAAWHWFLRVGRLEQILPIASPEHYELFGYERGRRSRGER